MADEKVITPEGFLPPNPVKGDGSPREILEFENPDGVSADGKVIDVFDDPAMNAIVADPALGTAVKEFAGLFDPKGELADTLSAMNPTEEIAALREIEAGMKEIFSSPKRAQEVLDAINSNLDKEPGKSYYGGLASEEVKDAMWRLMQVAHGETPVQRVRHPFKDGNSY